MKQKIVILGTDCQSTRLLYHSLAKEFVIDRVILEQRTSRWKLITRRVQKIGLVLTVGQVLFQVLLVPFLRIGGRKRARFILQESGYLDLEIPLGKISHVTTVNSQDCRNMLAVLLPIIVIVSGTRIVSSETLRCVEAKFINIHAGITPQYRGVHGGYWALWNGDRQNCGVTVHLVDRGIDTGGVLYRTKIHVTGDDNFTTYPLLQICAGIGLLKLAIADILAGNDRVECGSYDSKLWHHPTLWGYLWVRFTKSIK